MTITAAHIAEARALNPLTASRDAIAAASKIPTTHRRVGHAPLAGRGIDLRKLVRPLASLRRLLPSQRSLERATVVAIAVALLLEVLVAAGVHYSAFKNPGDTGWIFGGEKTFFGVEHYEGNREFMLCIDDHLIFGGSCG